MNQLSKKWREENPERMAELRAEWYERNFDYHKEYYQRNKERLSEKHSCSCGGRYSTSVRSKHFKSKKHASYLSTMRKYFNALKEEEHILLSPPSVAKQLAQAHQVLQKKWMDGINRMLKASPLLNKSNIKTSYKL
jgi:site-specific recombinase XerD